MLSEMTPDVVAIQETWLTKKRIINIKYYNIIGRDRRVEDRRGGVCLLIKNNIANSEIFLNTDMEAVAAQIDISSMYLQVEISLLRKLKISFQS